MNRESYWSMGSGQAEQILRELVQRGVTKKCLVCGVERLELLGVFFKNPKMVVDVTNCFIPLLEAPTPTVALVCRNCGALRNHLLSMLVDLEKYGLEARHIRGTRATAHKRELRKSAKYACARGYTEAGLGLEDDDFMSDFVESVKGYPL